MKKFFFVIASLLVLASCTKEHDLRGESGDSKIEFSLYNQTKSFQQVTAGAVTITGTKVYTFVATKDPTAENIFTLSFMTDSLRPGSYNTNTGIVNFREGSTVVTNVNSPDFIVTISSNVNGLVNGTFSGTLYDHATLSNCLIVEGKIENVQLH